MPEWHVFSLFRFVRHNKNAYNAGFELLKLICF